MDDYELLYEAQCSDRPSENIRAVHVFCQYVTILPMVNIWNEFAVQKAFLRKKGQLIEDADIIIGTTAIINNMVMVTENVKHIRTALWRSESHGIGRKEHRI